MEVLRVPLLNANEDELEVVDVLVEEGAEVRSGDPICVVESTKATFDVDAPAAGFIRMLKLEEGQRVKVGAVICVITATADEAIELPDEAAQVQAAGTRATRKAAALAAEHGIELSSLNISGIVKERDIRAFLKMAPSKPRATATEGLRVTGSTGEAVVVYGAGGHARVLIDLIREGRRDLHVVAAVDDSKNRPDRVLGVPVVGDASELGRLRERGIQYAVLGIGAVTNNALRIELYERLRTHGFIIPNLIHPRAAVEPSVRMGQGNQIFAGAVVSSAAELGNNTIINSGVVVSHDCRIGSHTHLTPGAILAGDVRVGENTVVGMGVTVYLGVEIGRDATIANGVHVMHDIGDGAVVRASRG
ncbi:MAG: NeuD/PglB/VioB family sugar acetyltransferase [Bradymonadaceae bacterium]